MKEIKTEMVERDENGNPREVFHKSAAPVLEEDNPELLKKLRKAEEKAGDGEK